MSSYARCPSKKAGSGVGLGVGAKGVLVSVGEMPEETESDSAVRKEAIYQPAHQSQKSEYQREIDDRGAFSH
jgi:hypothetical protein